MKIRADKLFYRLLFIFPLTTLFQAYFDGINKAVFGLTMLVMLYFGYRRIKKSVLLVMTALLVVYIFTLYATDGLPYNINELFYFPFAILYWYYMDGHIEALKKYLTDDEKYIRTTAIIWTVLVLISAAFPSSYTVEWGGSIYFGSFCKSVWRLAPACVFIMTIAIVGITLYKKRKYILLTFVPLISILAGGSRTYALVGLLLFVIAWYYYLSSTKIFWLSIIPMVLLLGALVLNSAIIDKINATSYTSTSYLDFWGTVTSGRSIFWAAEIRAFKNAGWINQLLGQGLNSIYEINETAVGAKIWAHNDFIQCLISHGIAGLALYLSAIAKMYHNFKKVPGAIVPKGLIFLVWLVNAFFNMCYTYFCAALSLPILIFCTMWGDTSKNEGGEIWESTSEITEGS